MSSGSRPINRWILSVIKVLLPWPSVAFRWYHRHQHSSATYDCNLEDKNGNPLKDKEITFTVPNDSQVGSRLVTAEKAWRIVTGFNRLPDRHVSGHAYDHGSSGYSNVSDTQPMTFVADKDSAVSFCKHRKRKSLGMAWMRRRCSNSKRSFW